VKAIGTATRFLLKRASHRNLTENQVTSKKKIPGWSVLRVSPAKSVLLYSQTLFFTVSETSECFLSKLYAYPSFWA
jgi:hypothetical protein